jgi:AcrR family transcriptional regulator
MIYEESSQISIEPSKAKEPKRERGKQRVASLLDAGAALFVEKGYEATTMTEIAARAGAAIGSLYQFFPSKEAIAQALFSRYAERATALLDDLMERAPASSPAQLADILIDLMLELRTDRDVAKALPDAVADSVERRKPMRYAFRGRIAAILRAANGDLTEAAAAGAATMIAMILKAVPALVEQETETGQRLVAEARTVLTLYIAHIVAR